MNGTLVLLQFIPPAIVLVLANMEEQSPVFRWLTIIALSLLNLVFIMLGLTGVMMAGLGVSSLAEGGLPVDVAEATISSLRALGLVGILGFLPLLRPLRVWIARLLPIDPDSGVHMTALVFAIYLLGMGLGQQSLLTDADAIGALNLEVTSSLIWAQGLGMVLLAITGIGAFVRRDGRGTLERFGLTQLSLRDLGVTAAAIIALFVLQIVVTVLWRTLDPVGFEQIDTANSLLLGQLSGIGAAFAIGLSAAVGEELVFRGALQPRFGLVVTAVLFTVIHSQYGFSPATLLILAIALILGLLRDRTSLSVCILVHFGYNFLSVMLPSLAQGEF